MRNTLLVLVHLIAVGAMAQTAARDSLDDVAAEMELCQVVVTGTRTPKLLKDVPVQTRLVTAADIRKTDATNIQDLLSQELPGVEFSYAMNQQTHLNFAGFGGQSILFLVDGERLAGETMDDVDFSRLIMADVERIEIAKGATSALYGSNAGGGVINIITKESVRPFSMNLNARYGQHNAQRYGGSIGLKRSGWQNMLTASYNTCDNYDVISAGNPVARVISTVYGDEVVNLRERLSCRFSPSFKLTGRAGYYFRQTVRTTDMPEQYRDFSAGLRGVWDVSACDNIELSYSFDQYDKSDKQRLTALNIRDYSNVQNIFRGLYTHTFPGGHMLTAGMDCVHDYIFNRNIAGNRRMQDCLDAFAQFDWRVSDKWEVLGALRYDYLSDGSFSRLTPKLNARYNPRRNLNIRLGYGMGFRAPTLKEKYYDFDMSGIWIVEGNAELKPETSHNVNASVEYTKGRLYFNLMAYYNSVANKIATAAPYFAAHSDKLPYLPYVNLADYHVYGGEASVQGRWSNGLGFRLSYALTKENLPNDREGTTVSNQYLPARTHALGARIDYDRQFSKRLGLDGVLSGRFLSSVESEEYRNYYNVSEGMLTVRYPAYTIWRLQATMRIREHLKVTLGVENIFNYKPKYYYLNSPLTDGTSLQAGASIDI